MDASTASPKQCPDLQGFQPVACAFIKVFLPWSVTAGAMITEAGPLNLRMGPAGMTCKLHPTVLVTICESFIRRKAGLRRVIGTLLGNATDDAIIVKDCYAVPHEEDDDQVRGDLMQPLRRPRRPARCNRQPYCARSRLGGISSGVPRWKFGAHSDIRTHWHPAA
jgi:JAB1/Mov34/MPN/PAD-1 ubiquitin protease